MLEATISTEGALPAICSWPVAILVAVEDKASKAWYPPEWGVGGKMTTALIANKIFTRMRSEVVCIAPALTTDEATIDELVSGVRNAIVTVFGE